MPVDESNEVYSAARSHWLWRLVPALDSARDYSRSTFVADLLAGLTVAAVAVPQAMAYALLAGVPPQYGLYTAIIMTAVGAIFDSSKQLINGPTNAISIALLSSLARWPGADDPNQRIQIVIMMALLIGLIQTGITLLRLGDLTRYISHAVIIGFTVGASILLFMDQLKHLLGLQAQGEGRDHFLRRFVVTLWNGGPIHAATAWIGLGTVLFIVVLRWLNQRWLLPRGIRLPEFLLAVVGSALVVWLCNLQQAGVKVIGAVPSHLPTVRVPTLSLSQLQVFAPSALAIALLGLLEAVAMAKSIAAKTKQKLDINQQCLSEGLANIVGSFFQCMPGSGSLTRSAINQQSGAKTQWSGVISAAAVAVVMVLFAGCAEYIPRSALAGILMLTAVRMIDPKEVLYHLRATRFDAAIVIATALAAVVVNVEFCILIGTFLSFVFFVPKAARVHVTQLTATPERVVREKKADDPECGRLLLFDIEGELFFGAGPDLEEHLDHIADLAGPQARIIVLRLKRVRNPDAVCLKLIDDFVEQMRGRSIRVLMCGVRHDVSLAFAKTGLDARLGAGAIFHEHESAWSSTLEAVRQAYALLGADLCDHCPQRAVLAQEKTEGWYYMI